MSKIYREISNGKLRKTDEVYIKADTNYFVADDANPSVQGKNYWFGLTTSGPLVINNLVDAEIGQVVYITGPSLDYIRFNASNENFNIPADVVLTHHDTLCLIYAGAVWNFMWVEYGISTNEVTGSTSSLDLAKSKVVDMHSFTSSTDVTSVTNARIGDTYTIQIGDPGAFNPIIKASTTITPTSFHLISDFSCTEHATLVVRAISDTEVVEVSRSNPTS